MTIDSIERAATPDSLTALLPELTGTEWAKFGGGVALVLAGSGLVSIATLARLALVATGGVLAYRTWNDVTHRDTEAAPPTDGARTPSATRESTRDTSPAAVQAGNLSSDARPSLAETLASGRDANAPGLAGAGGVPQVDLRGA